MNYVDDDHILCVPGRDPIQLEEGKQAYAEAIEQLLGLPVTMRLEPLEWSELLEKAAIAH